MFRKCLLFKTKIGSFIEQAYLIILHLTIFYKAYNYLTEISAMSHY